MSRSRCRPRSRVAGSSRRECARQHSTVTTRTPVERRMTARLRVLHLGLEAATARPGGLNRYLEALVGAERGIGIEASAVVLGDAEGVPLDDDGIEVVGPRAAPLRERMRLMARAAGRRPLPDLVDAHFALYALAPVLTRLRRVPLVVHFQGPWALESATEGGSRMASMVKRALERAVYRRADAVVVLSEAFKQIAVSNYGVSASRVHRVPPGVDLATFSPGDRQSARRALGVNEATTLVVAVRRLRNRMGLEVAIEAVAGSDPTLDLELVVVGEGPERARLEELAATLGAPVRFVGRVSDEVLVEWYRAADLSVVPTVSLEGFGLVVLESLAVGTPVVASNVDGLRDAMEGLPNAVVVPPGDAPALRSAIEGVISGAIPRPSLHECRTFAEGHSWARVAERHQVLYEQVLSGSIGSARPRVVIVGHTAALSGGELALARLAPSLSDHAEIHVILAEDGPLRDRLESEGISVEILSLSERARAMRKDSVTRRGLSAVVAIDTARYVWKLRRRLRSLRPDIVHTNTLKAALYGGLSARAAGVPVVIWHVRDRISEDYLPPTAVRLVRSARRLLADGVIANSEATLHTLAPGGVRSEVIASPLERSVTPRAHRVPGPLVVGMVGRLAPWKGQLLFVDAFADAFGDGDEHGVIVGAALFGEEDYEQTVKERIDARGMGDRISLLGFRSDVGAELHELDVLVHCSVTPEPFGQVVVEGMAAGLPVIAAGAGGPAEIITDGVDGMLYPMGDRDSLVAALHEVASSRRLREVLGAAAAKSAQRYAAPAVAERVASFYREMLDDA